MTQVTPAEVRDYLAGLALASEYEIEELRNTPIETKLRQIWALMGSTALFEDSAQRGADHREIRERWARLHRAHCA
ncbi:MAG: hypothetical protein A3H91_10130 [Gammaproteobacteria bacterium RIFCSPLOWO2_02_FULL_61_13]|nr:MAG: hypothetical protein A3H91_10130 [Gammaproteobacteria bacterium RIFCSPLOWO2_02_FULL_61_13]